MQKETTPAGLEPARENPKRFLIFRLNRSAIVPNNLLFIFHDLQVVFLETLRNLYYIPILWINVLG